MPELILDHEPWRVPISMFGRRAKIVDRDAFSEALGEDGLNLPLESGEPGRMAANKDVISTCQLMLGDYQAAVDAPSGAYRSPAVVRANLERVRAQCEALEATLRPRWRGGSPDALGPFEARWIAAAGASLPDLRELYHQVRDVRETLAAVLRYPPLKAGRKERRDLPLDLTITGLLRVFRAHYSKPTDRRISTLREGPPLKAVARMIFVTRMLKAAGIEYPQGSLEERVARINARLGRASEWLKANEPPAAV